jgi:hypothetical protein
MQRTLKAIFTLVTLALHANAETPAQELAAITALQAQVAALKETVATLQSQVTTVRNNPVLALGPYVSIDFNYENEVPPPHVVFKGVNVHIVDGSGSTKPIQSTRPGLGNLIIGYNELPGLASRYNPGDREGNHNLILGRYNLFNEDAFGCFVTGQNNLVSGEGSSILSGTFNQAAGLSTVLGGTGNRTISQYSIVPNPVSTPSPTLIP